MPEFKEDTMDGYKQYIRPNANGIVVKGFTDAFEQPIAGDLLLTGQDGRHFQMQLANDRNQYLYKVVSGQMIQRTQAELDTEWNARPPAPPSDNKRLADMESALLSLMGL